MAYAHVQSKENDGGILIGSISTGAFSSSLTPGNLMVCFVWYIQTGAPTSVTLSGGGSPTWNAETVVSSADEHLHAFYAMNVPGGTTAQVTATFGANSSYPAIWVAEYSGFTTTGARLAYTGQNFATPSAGADAVTSGLLGTLSNQPAGIVGFCNNENADGAPTVGTSPTAFVSRGTGWDYAGEGGSTPGARLEDARVTATTSVAATFGRGGTLQHKAVAFAFKEVTSSSAATTRYNSFSEQMGDGTIDLDNDTFKVCLATSSYTPSASHTQLSDVSANRVSGTTDTALTSVTWAQTSGVATFDAADTVVSFTTTQAVKYAVIYSDTSTNDNLVGYVTLPDGISIAAGDSLRLIWDSTGIFTLN